MEEAGEMEQLAMCWLQKQEDQNSASQDSRKKLGMVVDAFIPSAGKTDTGVQDNPQVYWSANLAKKE